MTIDGKVASTSGRVPTREPGERRLRLNTDVLEGKWKQMRGQMKEWWGKLTDQDLDVIDGKRDKLIGALQEKYGWAKRDAENEVSRRLREIRPTDAASRG